MVHSFNHEFKIKKGGQVIAHPFFIKNQMVVDSHNIEFGYELLSALPYAYELYLKGELTGTKSGFDTEPLYYFSPNHEINPNERSWFNTEKARINGLPYTFIHRPEQPEKSFPKFKEVYANNEYKWKKQTICICNRKNEEWSYKAINYFDEQILDWMFENLKRKYEIIYFPVNLPKELQDSVEPIEMNDVGIAKKHKVKLFTELRAGKSWNETLLKVFANCENYITMNGGYSIMASLFTGTNIIYSKPGEIETRELKQKSFWRWYPNLNDVRTLHVPDYEELKSKIISIYLKKQPCLNILVRTNRPNYLNECIRSIEEQTYENINLVLICDSEKAIEYTRGYNARMVKVKRQNVRSQEKEGDENYGRYFPYNKYIDTVQKKVKGYILILDDDDKLTDQDSAKEIIKNADKNSLLLWKVNFNNRIIPQNTFGKEITLYDITGIGMCYHSDYIEQTDWSEWKRADYRTAKKLSETLKVKWIDKVLTGIQDVPGYGTKKDLIIHENQVRVKITYPDNREFSQLITKDEYESFKPIFKLQNICIELMK